MPSGNTESALKRFTSGLYLESTLSRPNVACLLTAADMGSLLGLMVCMPARLVLFFLGDLDRASFEGLEVLDTYDS